MSPMTRADWEQFRDLQNDDRNDTRLSSVEKQLAVHLTECRVTSMWLRRAVIVGFLLTWVFQFGGSPKAADLLKMLSSIL